ncbi:hypothetical protein ACTA71_009416 [Dictyostelium dimigraforme]
MRILNKCLYENSTQVSYHYFKNLIGDILNQDCETINTTVNYSTSHVQGIKTINFLVEIERNENSLLKMKNNSLKPMDEISITNLIKSFQSNPKLELYLIIILVIQEYQFFNGDFFNETDSDGFNYLHYYFEFRTTPNTGNDIKSFFKFKRIPCYKEYEKVRKNPIVNALKNKTRGLEIISEFYNNGASDNYFDYDIFDKSIELGNFNGFKLLMAISPWFSYGIIIPEMIEQSPSQEIKSFYHNEIRWFSKVTNQNYENGKKSYDLYIPNENFIDLLIQITSVKYDDYKTKLSSFHDFNIPEIEKINIINPISISHQQIIENTKFGNRITLANLLTNQNDNSIEVRVSIKCFGEINLNSLCKFYNYIENYNSTKKTITKPKLYGYYFLDYKIFIVFEESN